MKEIVNLVFDETFKIYLRRYLKFNLILINPSFNIVNLSTYTLI